MVARLWDASAGTRQTRSLATGRCTSPGAAPETAPASERWAQMTLAARILPNLVDHPLKGCYLFLFGLAIDELGHVRCRLIVFGAHILLLRARPAVR